MSAWPPPSLGGFGIVAGSSVGPGLSVGFVGDPTPILVVQEITVRFGGITAIDAVSFALERGESLALVGPNGAGKTTLFNCICGQVRPDSGTILFDGNPLDGVPTYRRARMGIARTYQRIEVFPDLTVRDHLMVAERVRRGGGGLLRDLVGRGDPSAEEREHAEEVMELVGLSDRADVPVAALGLGTCRLVELGRALVAEPRLLLADEPSSGLDVQETAELAHVLRTLQQEKSMSLLLVEHDLQMVAEVVDRAVVVDLGRVIADGPFNDVVSDPLVRRAYLGTS